MWHPVFPVLLAILLAGCIGSEPSPPPADLTLKDMLVNSDEASPLRLAPLDAFAPVGTFSGFGMDANPGPSATLFQPGSQANLTAVYWNGPDRAQTLQSSALRFGNGTAAQEWMVENNDCVNERAGVRTLVAGPFVAHVVGLLHSGAQEEDGASDGVTESAARSLARRTGATFWCATREGGMDAPDSPYSEPFSPRRWLSAGRVGPQAISPRNDVDTWWFNLTNPAWIDIATSGTDPGPGTIVFLGNMNGQIDASATLSNGGERPGVWGRLQHRLEPGEYYVTVASFYRRAPIHEYWLDIAATPIGETA